MEFQRKQAYEPLLIAAPLEGLKRVIADMAELQESHRQNIVEALGTKDFQVYVEHALRLDQVAEGLDSLIKHLRAQDKVPLLALGENDIPGRGLMVMDGGDKALGDPVVWPAGSRQLITYAGMHALDNCPDMMPQPAHYYPSSQLVVGNDSGVIPFFRLIDIREQGGAVKVVRYRFDAPG